MWFEESYCHDTKSKTFQERRKWRLRLAQTARFLWKWTRSLKETANQKERLNMKTNKVTPNGGLTKRHSSGMNMKPNQLKEFSLSEIDTKVVTSANTGVDNMTSNHMLNWLECVRSRAKTNAQVEAGYNHSIANIMTTASMRTGLKATFDEKNQEVLAGGKVFKY